LFEAEIWLVEADSELSILTEQSTAVRQMLRERQNDVASLQAQLRDIREACKRLLTEFQNLKSTLSEEEQEFVQSWISDSSKTIQDLNNEIESTQQRLELLHEGNPRAIEQFEKRAKEIEKVQEQIANFERDLADMEEQIKSTREQWEPELDRLVVQISDAFSNNFKKIHCTGEVCVRKDDEDFKEWAIEIKVKFR
jgi:structural maintenance of chromosomes protein 5